MNEEKGEIFTVPTSQVWTGQSPPVKDFALQAILKGFEEFTAKTELSEAKKQTELSEGIRKGLPIDIREIVAEYANEFAREDVMCSRGLDFLTKQAMPHQDYTDCIQWWLRNDEDAVIERLQTLIGPDWDVRAVNSTEIIRLSIYATHESLGKVVILDGDSFQKIEKQIRERAAKDEEEEEDEEYFL